MATLTPVSDAQGRPIPPAQRRPLRVHFNPEKLELSITNAMEQNRNRRRREPPQLVTESSAKLTLELLFDTTASGADVRLTTFQVAQMMQPRPGPSQRGERRGVPAIVLFEWGNFAIQGFIDSYRETLDLFAPEGVPLRATLSLSITEQEMPFRPPVQRPQPTPGQDAAVLPANPAESLDALGERLGISRGGAQALAQENGIENLRQPGVDQVAVPRTVPAYRPPPQPAPFLATTRADASAGAGFGPAPTDFGASAFASTSASAGPGDGATTLASFSRLSTPPEIRFEPPRLSQLGGASAGVDLKAGIGIGGVAGGGASLGAKAGITASASVSGLQPGGGITAEVGARADAAIIIEERT
jgi:hypothetical protein